MKLFVINTGFFKLDGGAMFGVVPKTMWQKLNAPDENNLCTWAMRCLLIDTGERRILIDTGIGNKQDEKFRSHFHPHGDLSLEKSLAKYGFSPDDITDVFLTHLHFDHCGGALFIDENKECKPFFKNAQYWSNKKHWNWAMKPNPREAASFLKENFVPLKDQKLIQWVDNKQNINWIPNIDVFFAYGHTEAMMCPIIKYNDKTIIYCADTMPSPNHIGLPYVMSYDIRPLQSIKDKSFLLDYALENNGILFFEHDPIIEAATIKKDEKGRVVIDKKGNLFDFI